jgi:hypothetical protein
MEWYGEFALIVTPDLAVSGDFAAAIETKKSELEIKATIAIDTLACAGAFFRASEPETVTTNSSDRNSSFVD